MSNPPALIEVQSNTLTPRWTWVNPTEFLTTTHARIITEWAIALFGHIRPSLPAPSRRGPKRVYRDSSVIVMALIHVAWQLSYEDVVDYFRAHSDAAATAGFAKGRVISVGQYWERPHALDILPFWFFFVGMVWQLIRLAVVQGTDVIMDATIQRTWFHDDPEAGWSFPKPWKGSAWGQSPYAGMPLGTVARHVSGHLRQSAGVLGRHPLAHLGSSLFRFLEQDRVCGCGLLYDADFEFHPHRAGRRVHIDYNLRRRGKHFLATLFFLKQWRFHQRPRAIIERHFAWAKRYFGLESGRWCGLVAALSAHGVSL